MTNSKDDLERFDPDTLTYIIKIHGAIEKPETLILTEDQYDNYQHKDENKYYRDFLKSYFLAQKFFIVGYSINDPYIVDLLKSLTANFRRQVPIFAILSDVSNSQIRDLNNRCNIKVFHYTNKSGTHKELTNILEAISKFIRTDQDQIIKRDETDLKRAQSLYMWHKFQLSKSEENLDIDSIKSILLTIINDSYYKVVFSQKDLLTALNKLLGVKSDSFLKIIESALVDLVDVNFIERVDNASYKGTVKLFQYVKRYNHQYDDLLESYVTEIANNFVKNIDGIDSQHIEQVKKAAVDVIIDLFSERAIEIIKMIFEKKPIIIQQASILFKLINLRAKDISNHPVRFYFIKYISDMLTSPTKVQENILEYYSKAYFSIQALQIDPIGEEFRKQFLSNRAILVDSTVIIPLLAHSCLDYDFFNAVVGACKENQIKLVTTSCLIDEVYFHAEWAKKLINDNGDQSVAVLSAAIGNYPYKRNAFLDGYIRYCASNDHINFEDYLKIIFNKNLSNKDIVSQFLSEKYGIFQIDIDSFGKNADQIKYEKEKVFDFIEQKADENNKFDKSSFRKKSEAEAYVIIHNWS
ncbi:MAG: SIR2 family protein, partial [Ignavibacteriaceae bacterium]|nr:SIR2 family protein [Ignavibacteriaceae bacterium]